MVHIIYIVDGYEDNGTNISIFHGYDSNKN